MKTTIEDYDGFIVQKDKLFLLGCMKFGQVSPPQWTQYRWDAYHFEERDKANRVAKIVCGRVIAFNPITG